VVTCKWLFKCKYHADGTFAKYKAQFVARGFFQVEGVNYGETFYPMIKIISLCILIVLIVIYDYHIHQMDVQTIFFHGHFNEEFFLQQPPSYVLVGQETKVC